VRGEPICLVDGELVPLAAARISPLDRGFLFGDAVYEAMKVLGGRILFLAPHLERLARSLAAMRIPVPGGLEASLRRLVAAAGVESGSLYVQVSRGAAPLRSHLPPPGLAPTLFAFATPLDFPAEPWALPGVAAITRRDDRWSHCDVKTTALAASVVGKLAAADAGATESLFVSPAGELREGGNTNLFVRDARGWHTHPAGPEILAGVTRGLLLEAAAAAGDPVTERAPRLAERAGWREAFLCGTLTGVRGLVDLDGTPIGDGEVGAGTRQFARSLSERERAAAWEIE
jgi:D-alanine transaminase